MPVGRIRPREWPSGTFPTFVVLGINIITSIGGVAFPESLMVRQVVYTLLLIFCAVFLLSYVFIKHGFLSVTRSIRPFCADVCPGIQLAKERQWLRSCLCNWSIVHDTAFCLMAMLYLMGDNLEMACELMLCPITARALVGISLILNIFITLINTFGLVPNLPAAFPVIGIIGHVYNSMMQIAAQALTIDQTLTTIVESVDINVSNGAISARGFAFQGMTLIVDSERKAQEAAAAFTAVLYVIVLAIVMFLLVRLAYANKRVCCDCRCKKVKWYELVGQLVCGILVMGFVLLFMASDIDWVWKFFKMSPVSKPGVIVRLLFLCVSLGLLCIVMLVYIMGLCLPGACFVWGERKFFLSKHSSMKVTGHMQRSEYNEWDYKKGPPSVNCKHVKSDNMKCELNSKINVEEYFGKADITISMDEHDKIKCWDGLWAWIDWEHGPPSAAAGHLEMKVDVRKGNTGGVQGENTTPANGALGAPSNGEFEGSGEDSTQTKNNNMRTQSVDGSIHDPPCENSRN